MRVNRYFLSTICGFAAFTATMLAVPYETVHSQDTPKPSQPAKVPPSTDTFTPTNAAPILEQIEGKKEELKSNAKSIREGSQENLKRVDRLEKLVDKLPTPETNELPPVVDTHKIFVKEEVPVPFEVADSAMLGKTWFGQLFVHFKRCRGNKIFKPKEWGKGKF